MQGSESPKRVVRKTKSKTKEASATGERKETQPSDERKAYFSKQTKAVVDIAHN